MCQKSTQNPRGGMQSGSESRQDREHQHRKAILSSDEEATDTTPIDDNRAGATSTVVVCRMLHRFLNRGL